jgi:hypothetical protein
MEITISHDGTATGHAGSCRLADALRAVFAAGANGEELEITVPEMIDSERKEQRPQDNTRCGGW